MPALPTVSALTGSTVTEAQFKQAITDQRDFLASLLGADGSIPSALAAMGALISGYLARTSAYTVVLGDRGKLIDCSGTFTLAFTAAATLGAGFTVAVRNSGSGVITLDPAGTELIDTSTTITLQPNESHLVVCTGTAWRSLGRTETSNLASAEYVNQSFSLFQTFGSLSVGATRSIGATNYRLWETSSPQGGRGAYYTNLFYAYGDAYNTYYANVGPCRVSIWNYSTTKSMQITLSAVINFASDDTYAFQVRQNGSTVATFGAYSARNVQNYNFGTYTAPANTRTDFDLYGSILSGSNYDALYVNSFTGTYVQFV